MAISSNKDQFVVSCRGRDPDVVFRQWTTLLLQPLFQKAVFAGDMKIAQDDCSAGGESLYPRHVFSRPPGLRPKNSLPRATAGTNTSRARSRLESTAASPSSKAMTIFVSSRSLPLAGVNLLTLSFDCLAHLLSRNQIETVRELTQGRAGFSYWRRSCQ